MLEDSGVYAEEEACIEVKLRITVSKVQADHIRNLMAAGHSTDDAIAKACNVPIEKLQKQNFMLLYLNE